MSKKQTPFLKTVEAVALALGLKLYDQRKQKSGQLEKLKSEILKAEGFPAQAKGLWPRASVVDWGRDHLKLSKNKREFVVIKAEAGNPKVETELPEQGELIEAKPVAFEALLDQWQQKLANPDMWLDAPLQNWQLKKLEKHRPQLFQATPTDGDENSVNVVGGVRGVAGYINNHFNGLNVTHQDIHNWRKGEYLPAGCKENFPPPDEKGSNRYKKSDIDPWVQKHLKPLPSGQVLPLTLDDRQRKERADARMAELELEQLEREVSNKYVLTETAKRTGTAIGIAARNSVREALEKNMINRVTPWLAEFVKDDAGRFNFIENLRAQCIGAFTEWQGQFAGQLEGLLKRNINLQTTNEKEMKG